MELRMILGVILGFVGIGLFIYAVYKKYKKDHK